MKRLLVYCYFCPDAPHRPGGVQQIVGPLLSALEEARQWVVTVVHPGICHSTPPHVGIPGYGEIVRPDAVDTAALLEDARCLSMLAADHDVVLSVDRILPCPLARSCVLMSNTLSYQTELVAVQAAQWTRIVVPTASHGNFIRTINPATPVHVVPYGLLEEVVREALATPPPVWGGELSIVRLPHRPDPRKGHAEAIEGLARSLPESRHVRLDISWLDEERYAFYRKELEGLAHRLGVEQQVIFSGWHNGSDRWDAVVGSSAVLQLGKFEETFGLSIVESILFGRPAVTRHQRAIREIVGSTTLFLEVRDPLAWYWTLNSYWSHGTKQDTETQERRRLAQLLSLDQMAVRYDRVLTEAITRSRGTRES